MSKKVKAQKETAVSKIEADLKEKGFKKLDKDLIKHNPPKIKWGEKFEAMEDEKKIDYLKKLAATMNEAARLVQDERDELNKLLVLKEEQLEKQEEMMIKNHEMVQKEVLKMNEERQKWNEASQDLKGDALKAYLKNVT